jgi:hypothetical protein
VKPRVTLVVASLLSILFMTLHHADDILRGMAPGNTINILVVLFLVGWLYGTLMLADRRSGLAIVFVASLLASGIPIVHMTGPGLAGGAIANTTGAYFFVWTLIALGVTTLFSVVLSRALWKGTSEWPAGSTTRA